MDCETHNVCITEFRLWYSWHLFISHLLRRRSKNLSQCWVNSIVAKPLNKKDNDEWGHEEMGIGKIFLLVEKSRLSQEDRELCRESKLSIIDTQFSLYTWWKYLWTVPNWWWRPQINYVAVSNSIHSCGTSGFVDESDGQHFLSLTERYPLVLPVCLTTPWKGFRNSHTFLYTTTAKEPSFLQKKKIE